MSADRQEAGGASKPPMIYLRLRMSHANAETLLGLLDGTGGSCADAGLRRLCERLSTRIETQIDQQIANHDPDPA